MFFGTSRHFLHGKFQQQIARLLFPGQGSQRLGMLGWAEGVTRGVKWWVSPMVKNAGKNGVFTGIFFEFVFLECNEICLLYI